jgi:hypothetical protein
MHAGEPEWRTGRITTVRVLERSEVQGSVTPPVQEDGRGEPNAGRSYGASAYLVVQSGKDNYQAQYAGPQIGALEQLRSRTVQFRIAGSKLYLRPATGRPLELQLLSAKRPPAETENPRK